METAGESKDTFSMGLRGNAGQRKLGQDAMNSPMRAAPLDRHYCKVKGRTANGCWRKHMEYSASWLCGDGGLESGGYQDRNKRPTRLVNTNLINGTWVSLNIGFVHHRDKFRDSEHFASQMSFIRPSNIPTNFPVKHNHQCMPPTHSFDHHQAVTILPYRTQL